MTDPHEDLVEVVARKIAAMTMGLVKDLHGTRLPEGLWKQTVPQARAAIALIAERTKEATPNQLDEAFRAFVPSSDANACWHAMHRASALWPKEKP